MKKICITLLLLGLSVILISCSDVVISGRSRLNFVPDSEINQMAADSYAQFLTDNKDKLNTDKANTELVRRVGGRIQKAVEDYMASQGKADELSGYKWEFNLIDSPEVNAWAMPGGKVVVYTGILPYTQDENGLAVVMSHEIAHVIAKHGAEQMSQDLLLQAGGTVIQKYGASNAFLQAFSIGSTYGIKLPYSRTHEYEADHLGLIFMAMAGYDPYQAPIFWKRMSQSGGSGTPEFMSTHPSDENRIAKLNQLMPEVDKYRK